MADDPRNLGQDLRIGIDDLPCPQCDSLYATIAEVLAPDELEEATRETFVRTSTGGLGGAAVGALAGPVGVVAGGILGSAWGGKTAIEKREKRRAILHCGDCGYHGNVLGESNLR